MTAIRREQDGEELIAFIEKGRGRTGKSVEIPAPEGLAQAGWTTIQGLKVQPEVFTMLEQLREHKLFKGKWKTASQVAWSMIYLGLTSCYQFWSKDNEDWSDFRSNYLAVSQANAIAANLRKQEQLLASARQFRTTCHAYLNKGTAFGRYKAWSVLDKALSVRDVVEDVKQFDQLMRAPTAPALNDQMVFDNRAGEYWNKLIPVNAGPLDEAAADALYLELTQEHFDELDAANRDTHAD